MATLDWHTTGHGGVTLVELLVTSETTERVRIENCLDGPVWPPRRQGVPAEGWTGDGFEGLVGPDDRLVVGYASPAAPADPPARIVESDPDADEDAATTACDLVRTLGDPAPPRAAVPTPDESDRDATDRKPVETGGGDDSPRPTATDERLPPEVASYLNAVTDRVADAERLGGPATVGEASEALAAVGGPEEAAALQSQLAADAEALSRLQARCERLAARIDAVDVPVETLARVA